MKVSKELRIKAAKAAKELGCKTMYANDKGELFSVHNLAMLSVGNDKERMATLSFEALMDAEEDSIQHTITQDDFDLNPELAEQGVSVGEKITIDKKAASGKPARSRAK